MNFKMKYEIKQDLLPVVKVGRRQGILMPRVRFIVLHDVGNDGYSKKTGRRNGTTAKNNISYYKNTKDVQASAHSFIDDIEILECIPATTGKPEKAWHVMYDKPLDNQMFGDDANDIAIGVELCYFPEDKARAQKAYDKYVWYVAYLIHYYKLPLNDCLIGHEHLDPGRKSDPTNGIKHIGKTYNQLVSDIKREYNECISSTKEVIKVDRDINKVSEWAAEDWKEATENGYFDGTRPGAFVTREELAIVVNRLRRNLIEGK